MRVEQGNPMPSIIVASSSLHYIRYHHEILYSIKMVFSSDYYYEVLNEGQIVQLTDMLKISNHGHILYTYDSVDRYVENAVSYIMTGIELGHHLFIIDNKLRSARIYRRLQESLSHDELKCIHYVDNVSILWFIRRFSL